MLLAPSGFLIWYLAYFSAAELLGARPNMALDRRKSHTGVPIRTRGQQHRGSVSHQFTTGGGPGSGGGGYGDQVRRGAGTSSNLGGGQMLLVPNARARGSSLPGNMEVVNQDDIYRLRNFSTAWRAVITVPGWAAWADWSTCLRVRGGI